MASQAWQDGSLKNEVSRSCCWAGEIALESQQNSLFQELQTASPLGQVVPWSIDQNWSTAEKTEENHLKGNGQVKMAVH